jgi:hypothetical protein
MESTMKPASDWRSVIKVHPAADLFPMMSPEELRALGEDIKMNGLKVPPETWLDEGGTEWLIDGRNRLDALASLGYRFIRRETRHGEWTQHEHLIIYEPTGRKTVQVRQHGGDPCELATSLNITRRHLTTAQKSELIAKLLKADPTKSDRAVAKLAHVDNKTVAAKREQLEAGEEIPHQEARVGRDGKVQPAAKKSARKAAGAPAAAKKSSPKDEPELWWEEIAARDDIKAILSACVPLTPRDREYLRIALIECPEMRMLALAPRVDERSLPTNVRATLAIHALGKWTEYFTASLAPLIDRPNEDLDPDIHAALIEAVAGAMRLGSAPATPENPTGPSLADAAE